MKLAVHPLAALFPPMTDEEFAALKDSIRRNGQRDPIIVHEGAIVDGRHRHRACEELGIEPNVLEWDGRGSLLDLVRDRNLHRRSLTPSQRAAVGADLVAMEAQERRRPADSGSVARVPPKGKARDRAAKTVGASPRLVQDAIAVRRSSPETFQALKSGEISLAEAKRAIAPPPPISRVKGDDAIGRANEFADLVRRTHALKNEVATLAKDPVGRELRMQQIVAAFENAAAAIRFATPHSLCQCAGKNAKCPACAGQGWVTKEQHELQKAAER